MGSMIVPDLEGRDRRGLYDWLYERAEDVARLGLPEEDALQAVLDGYSSHAADQDVRLDP
jgi:hypothetical protein